MENGISGHESKNECYRVFPKEMRILHSDESDDISKRIGKFLEKYQNRSIILLGRPGTGKTTAICSIIDLNQFILIKKLLVGMEQVLV